jgi:hypothetical protein
LGISSDGSELVKKSEFNKWLTHQPLISAFLTFKVNAFIGCSMKIPRPATGSPTVLPQPTHFPVPLMQSSESQAPPPVPPRSSSRMATTPHYNIRI